MRGLLPSVWLLLAGLYTASLFALIQPFSFAEDWPTPPPAHETVRGKEPQPAALPPPAEAAASSVQRVSLVAPVAPKGVERQDQWVQIGGYTTVARAEPTTAAPVLFAYTPGRPLRVIAREGGFAHVQDLGSGQYGWVKESALAPFTGGDRPREDVAPQPQVVAAAAPDPAPEQVAAPQATPAKMASAKPVVKAVLVATKKLQPPRGDAAAARPDKETVAAAEPGQRGFFGLRHNRPQRIALSGNDSGFAGIISRAFGR
jgi:SH3 domain-containing protein